MASACADLPPGINARTAGTCRDVVVTSVGSGTHNQTRCDIPGEGVFVSLGDGVLLPLTDSLVKAMSTMSPVSVEFVFTARELVPAALGNSLSNGAGESDLSPQSMEDPDAGGGSGPIACGVAISVRNGAAVVLWAARVAYNMALIEESEHPGSPQYEAALQQAELDVNLASAALILAQLACVLACLAPTP